MRARTPLGSFGRPFAALFVLLLTTMIQAQITPSDDSYINNAAPAINYGGAVTLGVSGTTQTAYITFDLSSVPSGYTGSSVAKASLKLYVNTVTTAGSFNVDYVNSSWAEKTINANNAPPPGATIAASVPLAKSQALDYIVIDITTAVQAWLNGTQPNYGVALMANNTFAATFDSKESKTQSHPPELDVVFAGGGGGGITGVLTGAGSGLQGGGTSGTLNISLLTSCASGQVLAWNGSAWACTNMGGGGGTVTSVGLTAPSTDFIVTGSPVTTSGTLGLGWLVAPDYNNTPGAIVKRDNSGNFSAGTINAMNGFNLGGNPFAFGSYNNGNAYVGFAGNATSTGTGNSGFGYGALAGRTTAANNTASGAYALGANTGGGANTAHGNSALQLNTTGSSNTGIGYFALRSNTTGSYNTAVGIGADVGSANLSNATAIGANAVVSASNALVLGGTGSNAVSVGIGTAKPGATLDVRGTGNFTGMVTFAQGQPFPGTGTVTSVGSGPGLTGGPIQTSGTLSIANAAVTNSMLVNPSLTINTGGDLKGGGTVALGGSLTLNVDNTKVPELSAKNTFTVDQMVNATLTATVLNVSTAGSFNIGGYPFAFGSVPSQNTFLGFAGNPAITGSNNSGTGYLALVHDTAGQENTASGSNALFSNTTGRDNTANGFYALYRNTIGSDNTATGVYALANNNIGVYNTALGFSAASQTDAVGNTGVGALALGNSATGDDNTAVGFVAGPDANSPGVYNSTAIGAHAIVSQSNALVLGCLNAINGCKHDVNVGIGTATPVYHLDITSGDMIVRGATNFPHAGDQANLYIGDPSHGIQAVNAQGIYIGAYNAQNALAVWDYGHVGVATGTSQPSNIFTVGRNQGAAVADSWTTYSSRRWKTNIHTLHGALNKIDQLRGVSYDLKDSGKHEIGVIAEEVGAVVPEVVSYEKNGKDAAGVDYGRLTALLIEATKEQQALLQSQQKQIRLQQEQMKEQQAEISGLRAQVRTIQAALTLRGRGNPEVRAVKSKVSNAGE